MKFKLLFFLFFFGLIGSTKTSFAQIIFQELEVYQGSSEPFQVNCPIGQPSLKDAPVDGNTIELTSINGNDYIFTYTPAPGFLGADGFSIEVITGFGPGGIEKVLYVVQIDVILSMIHSYDDFIHLTSQDSIIINPLANDESSNDNLTVSIAHVLRGEAIVNSDQSITYIPTENDNDYIVYSVTDDFNTVSSATIYISNEYEPTSALTHKDYEIASGNSQYIILPNDDFTYDATGVLDFGIVEQLNSFVYEYKSNTNIEGSDILTFTDTDDNEYEVAISIIEKYTDEGFVKDDLFYSASNTNIVFDVTLNDLYDQYVISDYSDDLIHMGSGEFSFTPEPYFSGVKSFSYTADDGVNEESGTIELVINNFKPTNYFEYTLSTPQNQPRVIEYDVPLGTEFYEIASLPSNGTVEIFAEEESVDLGCEEGIQKVFAIYTPDENYTGVDDITIKYCASDNNICTNVNITFDVVATAIEDCICIDDCVWPGDANGDGKVSVVDALSIGRFIGNGGSARVDSPYGSLYEGSSVANWNGSQVNGKNLKHVDTDGDGHITADDLGVVIDNYGDINSIIREDVLGIKSLPFLLTTDATEIDSGDLLVLNVIIGTEAYPAIDIHGVSFGLNLPPNLVDSSSVEVEYLESGYLVKDAPYIDLTHQPSDGVIHTAGTKTNSLGSTGHGIIATVSFIVEEDAEGFKEENTRSTSKKIGDIIATIEATDIIIEDSRGFKYALANTSLDIILKSGSDEELDQLTVYPNPANDLVLISSINGANLNSVSLYSIEGRLIKTINQINAVEVQVDLGTVAEGLYIIKASSGSNMYTTKLLKK